MTRMIIRVVTATLAAALAVVAALTSWTAPAAAGGWAVTYLDPMPRTMDPGVTYTIGFWLLQHGTHPYEGDDLGRVALTFTGGDRVTRSFAGVPLGEPAHFAAAVSLPAGEWRVEAVQGWFGPHRIGTLRVPGGLRLAPLPPGLASAIEGQEPGDHWGEIRPPIFPAGAGRAVLPPALVAARAPAEGEAAPASQAPREAIAAVSPAPRALGATRTVMADSPAPWWRSPYPVIGGAGLALIGLGAVTAIRRRKRSVSR